MNLRHIIHLELELAFPEDTTTHNAILEALERLPERLGFVSIQRAEVVRGMVDSDDCPAPKPPTR